MDAEVRVTQSNLCLIISFSPCERETVCPREDQTDSYVKELKQCLIYSRWCPMSARETLKKPILRISEVQIAQNEDTGGVLPYL